MKFTAVAICAVSLLAGVLTVDRSLFKTCEQSSFCRRCRKVQSNNSAYEVVPNTLNTYLDSITLDLFNKNNGHVFVLKVEGIEGDIFHATIDEKMPLKKRYRVTDALKGPVKLDSIKVIETKSELVIICGENKAVIQVSPFKIDFYRKEVLFVSANAKGLFKFEHYRTKPFKTGYNNNQALNVFNDADDEPGSWEEDFKSHHDSKPNGPEAVALDFTFPQARVLFGIPEHADTFALKSTSGGDPYRLYNLDVGKFELDNGMALYGSVPVIYGHGTKGTAGVFWMNAAETWVDIYNKDAQTDSAAHFMSESGIVDAFILLGETPQNTFKQYTDLTGVAPLPQQPALAFHQCRWNYNDEKDVITVSENFDVHDIPMDTMWLDIDYTDEKKYFTWNSKKFPHPLEMIGNLTTKGRHLTVIIDPHIKVSSDYYVHNDCSVKGYYTKSKDGVDFEGDCWPGKSSYPDFFNPVVRKYMADQYLLENFKTTTNDVFIWNDMNEPSVFDGPELTMSKDNLHNTTIGVYEHRAVHNMYGFMQTMSTFDGLYRRGNGKYRPFILTRSHFAGSQRYAAIWTGDNTADWTYLQASIKTCLTQAVSGISFCGSDVGGFFGNTTAELLERWHQTGAFTPFFRAHKNNDTARHEPWMFPDDTKLVIRDAIIKRYSYMPLWYVMFYEHERFGYPVMRPLLSHYPHDTETFTMDNQYLLSDRLLVHPVTQEGVTSVKVYFPCTCACVGCKCQSADIWYDIDDYNAYHTSGYHSIPVNRNKIPVFQRGGTIVPKKERVRGASTLMKNDPYTLIVCLNQFKEANGTLYADDEQSYEYRNGKYVYAQFQYKDDVLFSKFIDSNATFETVVTVESIVIVGLDRTPNVVTLVTPSEHVVLNVTKNDSSYTISKVNIPIVTSQWKINFNF